MGAEIARTHRDSRGADGSPRIYRQLRREGTRCSNKRVARLMRELGLRGHASTLYRRRPGVHQLYARTGNLRLEAPCPRVPTRSGWGI